MRTHDEQELVLRLLKQFKKINPNADVRILRGALDSLRVSNLLNYESLQFFVQYRDVGDLCDLINFLGEKTLSNEESLILADSYSDPLEILLGCSYIYRVSGMLLTRETFHLLATHDKPDFRAIATLQGYGISDYRIHRIFLTHENPINLLESFSNKDALFLISQHQMPEIFTSILIDLYHAEIATRENFILAYRNTNVSDLALLTSALCRVHILTEANFNLVVIRNDLNALAPIVSSLERDNVLMQANFESALSGARTFASIPHFSNQSRKCLLYNNTDYNITYITLKNIKRDLGLITAFFIAEQFIPLIGQLAAAAEAPFFIKQLITWKEILLVLMAVISRESDSLELIRKIKEIPSILSNIKIGTISPRESDVWFEDGLQTCEALVQVATFTDSKNFTEIMGVSLVGNPARSNYDSRMDYVYLDSRMVAQWNKPDCEIIETIYEWQKKINELIQTIKKISEKIKSLGCSSISYQTLFLNIIKFALLRQYPSELASIIIEATIEEKIKYMDDLKQDLAELKEFCSMKDINYQKETFTEDELRLYESNVEFEENISIDILINLLSDVGDLRFLIPHRSDSIPNLIAHSNLPTWFGLVFVAVRPDTPLQTRGQGRNQPPTLLPFLKATGPERDLNSPQPRINKKGATMFLYGAGMISSSMALHPQHGYTPERVHIHLPSLNPPPGTTLLSEEAYSYWNKSVQKNDLSDSGWCVNVQYNGSKYHLRNETQLLVVDVAYNFIDEEYLVDFGKNEQVTKFLLSQASVEDTDVTQWFVRETGLFHPGVRAQMMLDDAPGSLQSRYEFFLAQSILQNAGADQPLADRVANTLVSLSSTPDHPWRRIQDEPQALLFLQNRWIGHNEDPIIQRVKETYQMSTSFSGALTHKK